MTVSTIRAVCLAFNESASVADEPSSRDGFPVDLFMAGDVGTLFLLASGIFAPSIMVSTAVPATAILDLPLTRLLRGGAEDHALRSLSNGRYSTPVMAQTIAEAVLLTSILKALRGREADIDRTARSLHADNAPDKCNEAMQFMEPLALKIVDLIESLQPAEQENLTRHKIAELEQQLERYKNKGMTLTPDKKQPSSSPSNTASRPL